MPIIGNNSSAGKKPTTPTVGTAVDGGTGTTVNVPFTASTYIGKDTITYTALSSPGSISATSSGSPINITGLTTGTAYTFTVTGNTNYGVASDASTASNSVTPVVPNKFEFISAVKATGSRSYTISSIPQDYKSLQLRVFNVNYGNRILIRLNGSATQHYQLSWVVGPGVAQSSQLTTNSDIYTGSWLNGGAPYIIMDLPRYTGTQKASWISTSNGTAYVSGQNDRLYPFGGVYDDATAITSINCNIESNAWYGTIALYGIK